jgi:hypothetical protein
MWQTLAMVWKITAEGERPEFASGFYGASGNAIDHDGNLLQSNYYGDSISKVDRKGQAKPFVTNDLSGPVGIAINRKTGSQDQHELLSGDLRREDHIFQRNFGKQRLRRDR